MGAFPVRQPRPYIALALPVFRHREGHQRIQRHFSGAIRGNKLRGNAGQPHPALDNMRADAESRGHILDSLTLFDQRGERLELIGRVHRFTLNVFGDGCFQSSIARD